MSNPSPAAAANIGVKSDPKAKPIKLRAACNNCFSAKVKCNGDKSGCQRCLEKNLDCVYSESRVGKVVGKRRKRPLEEAVGTVDSSEAWVLDQRPFSYSIPSPAATNLSDTSSKRHCSDASWTSFLVDEAQEYFNLDESTEALQSIDMANRSRSISSSSSITGFHPPNGLPTPALSPPQFRYLSPAALEARPMSRQTSSTSQVSHPKLAPPRFLASVSATPEPTQLEDEETVCIKLLAHLKKHSNLKDQTHAFQLDLLQKSDASIRRILRSKNVRSNYTCHLLLSTIVTYLAAICEHICSCRAQSTGNDFSSAQQPRPNTQHSSSSVAASITSSSSSLANPTRLCVADTISIASEIGKLIKRRPYDGFQILGRHESHHVELDLRLQTALSTLDVIV